MWVDLGLEGFQLCFAQVDLLLAHSGHELLNAQHHVAEGVGQFPHLPGAAHRPVGKVVGVSLKALHSRSQPAQGAVQQTGEQPAGEQSGNQHDHCKHGGQTDHIPHVAVDQLVNIADAHNAPIAARHTGQTVDDRIVHIGAIPQGGECLGIFRFQARVQQLLLGVIDDVAVPVDEKAVAPLADAYIINVTGDAGKAQVQRDPGGLAALVQGSGHGDHPGVVTLKNGLHVGSGHVGSLRVERLSQVKGEILVDVLLWLSAGRPAVQQGSLGGIAGDSHHVGAELQKCGQQFIPVALMLQHGLLDQSHGLVHVLQIVAHRVGYLGNCLGAAGAGALNHGAAVAV